MSAARKEVTESVPITVCDICGEEIEYDKDDRDANRTLGVFEPMPESEHDAEIVRMKQPTQKTRLIRFGWPIGKRHQEAKDRYEEVKKENECKDWRERRDNPYPSTTWYDFHGECLSKLVKAAVRMRQGKPTPDIEQPVSPLAEFQEMIDRLGEHGAEVALEFTHHSGLADVQPPPIGGSRSFTRTVRITVSS